MGQFLPQNQGVSGKSNETWGDWMKQREAVVRLRGPTNPLPMDNAAYHAHGAVSKSHLDQVARSPLHYWARYLDPNRVALEPTPAMVIGSALHTHVLELDQWDANYATMPVGIDRRTKQGKAEWEAFSTAASGRTVLSHDDAQLVMKMGQAVFGHPAAAALLNLPGKAETTWMWRDSQTDLECKCRPDWLLDDRSIIVDLKTTEDASPAGFRKSIGNFRYHVQAAWYLHGIEQATGTCPEQFIFICVEKKPPHAVAVYAADAEMIKEGWQTAERDLEVLATCKDVDLWPGYSEQIEPISLPPWMRPRPEGGPLPLQQEIEMY